MNCNGYVITRENYCDNTNNHYMIPDYIDPNKIGKYVIVSDNVPFSNKVAPYKVVEVQSVDSDLQHSQQYNAKEFIADIVDDKDYQNLIVNKKKLKKVENILNGIWNEYPLDNKMKILRFAAPAHPGEIDEYNKALKIYESIKPLDY